MTAQNNKSSVLAILAETTEGTVVAPGAATDYVPLHDGGFSIEPSFEVLDNAEIRASIGSAKGVLGLERPKASFQQYFKHSGTEGTAPQNDLMIKSAFGAVETNATQYDTVAGSTTTVLNVDTGEGATFSRGEALLIKDATNGYSVRHVYSVSSDALTLDFALSNAPAATTNLGKAIMFYPANSGHPSLTTWLYRANGGAIEMMSGGRVTQMTIEAAAGQQISGSFDVEGVKYYYNPITITSSTRYLDFLDNATTRAAVVTAGVYRDPYELAAALAASMNALGSANTFTVTYVDSSGKFTIASNGSTLTLKWNTGANTANSIATKVGFTTAADSSAALTYTSANAQTLTSPYTPTYDSSDPLVAKANEVFLGDSADNVCFCASSISYTLANTRQEVECICSDSGIQESIISKREITLKIVALMTQYDVEKFYSFRSNRELRFSYAAGEKSGNNWVAGKVMTICIPSCTVTSHVLGDNNGIVTMELEVKAFVDSSANREGTLNFL